MAQPEKVFTAKTDGLSSIPGTLVVDGENRFSLTHKHSVAYAYSQTNKHAYAHKINTSIIKINNSNSNNLNFFNSKKQVTIQFKYT